MAKSAQVVIFYVYDKLQTIMKQMHGSIPNIFDFWTNPVVHLLLINSSIA